MAQLKPVSALPAVRPAVSRTRILIRDLRLQMLIGVYAHEETQKQEVVINIEATVEEPQDWKSARLEDWVCYDTAVQTVKAIAAEGHIALLETFGNRIADELMQDKRVVDIRISLEKTQAIPETRSVGIEVYKSKF